MTDYDYTTDLIVVGSGGGLCGAVTAAAEGLEVIVLEKEELLGGSTAMSGGVLWLPNNPLMQEQGVPDSLAQALEYFDTVVGDVGPASSHERRVAYVSGGIEMVRFLQREGMRLVRCEGYPDYYAGMRGVRGGSAEGRAIEPQVTNAAIVGPLRSKIRTGFPRPFGVVVKTGESTPIQLIRARRPRAFKAAVRVAFRTARKRVLRQQLICNGAALIAQMVKLAAEKDIPLWTGTPLVDLIVEDGVVQGVVARRNGRLVNIRARRGVLLSSGGFARNPEMRARYSPQPNAAQWTVANPGDTGEAIEVAIKHGAAVAQMDEAWWNPAYLLPEGRVGIALGERCKPHSIIVDTDGKRFFDESISYMEAGRQMYAHNAEGKSIPCWMIFDAENRKRYLFAMRQLIPTDWIDQGYVKQADTLDELAAITGVDAVGLKATVERFNGFCETGNDLDFHRGEGDYEKYQGDDGYSNPALGPISTAPYYAVALYPSDVGTCGGMVCDENSRVLREDGSPIEGLYAAGNCTATVMGRAYPGAGASIGNSFVFSYLAAKHVAATERVEAAAG